MAIKRRAFISMLVGAAGGLALPKWRIPDPTIILPTAWAGYDAVSYALGYTISEEAVADSLYKDSQLGILKPQQGDVLVYDYATRTFKSNLMPGLLKAWQDHYNDLPEFEDLFK